MFYKEYNPPEELESLIKCFWILEQDYSKEPFTDGERIWPDGHFEFILTSSRPYYRIENKIKKELPNNFLIGQFNKEILLNSFGYTRIVAIRFNAWGLFPLTGVNMRELTNKLTDLSLLFGNDIQHLVRKIVDLNSDQAIDILKGFITSKAQQLNRDTLLVANLAKDIYDVNGIITIRELLQKYPISQKKMQRLFIEHVGLTAKQFAKIIRFNKAKKLIEVDPFINLTQLAFECGYSDQPHFTKNFRELYGIPPSAHKDRIIKIRTFFEN